MRKLFLLILILLFVSASSHAWNIVMMGGGTPSGFNCSGLSTCAADGKLFDWDGSTVSMSSNVCSDGDTTATLVGEASLAGDKITLVDGSNDGGDYYWFAISIPINFKLFPQEDFTLTFTINYTVINDGGRIVEVKDNENKDKMWLEFETSSGNDIRFVRYRDSVGTPYINVVWDTNLSTSTNYDIVLKGGIGKTFTLKVNSTTYTDATAFQDLRLPPDLFIVGNSAAVNLEGTIDNARIYYGFCDDL